MVSWSDSASPLRLVSLEQGFCFGVSFILEKLPQRKLEAVFAFISHREIRENEETRVCSPSAATLMYLG
jgi:hypothetical protein